MPQFIDSPKIIKAIGNVPKIIKEFVGNVNTGSQKISIAKMESPADWKEPGQRPAFDEYTIVLKGTLFVDTKEKLFEVKEGQAIIVRKGEWIRYSTPGGAEYIAVCLPAFTPDSVNRDAE